MVGTSISIIDSKPQELMLISVQDITIELRNSLEQNETYILVKYMQVNIIHKIFFFFSDCVFIILKIFIIIVTRNLLFRDMFILLLCFEYY